MIRSIFIVLGAFVAMEGVSYLAHRYVYHKLLWIFHKSHHTPRMGLFEWNDVFPVFFASVAIAIFWYTMNTPGQGDLFALALGVTLYGMIYFFLHDIYVHGRLPGVVFRSNYLQRMKKAHMIHHAYGAEPYGLLLFPLKSMPAPKGNRKE
jgi:beta-carotene 3-hydroxylase